MEFTSACVVGPGRVGTAFAARLAESLPTRLTGRDLEIGDADLHSRFAAPATQQSLA